jgi:hypothetical protein
MTRLITTRGAAIAAAFLFLLLIPVLASAGPLYVSGSISGREGGLATFDTTTGKTTVVGDTGVTLNDIALNANDNPYGIGFSDLYRIDPTNASVTDIGNYRKVGLQFQIHSLAFSPNGTLYGTGLYGLSDYLFTLDTATEAILTGVGPLSGGFGPPDIAFDDGHLYGIGGHDNTLTEFDPATGATISSIPVSTTPREGSTSTSRGSR